MTILEVAADSLKWLKNKFGAWLFVLSPIIGFLAYAEEILAGMSGTLAELNSAIEAVTAGLSTTVPAWVEVWRLANYAFPVSFAIVVAFACLQVRILSAVIRLLKSLLPFWN